MATLVLDKPERKPRLVLDKPPKQPDFGMIVIPREELPGVWEYNRQLDDLLGDPEKSIEDLMPLDVRYEFGRIVGMTEKPDETKDRMKSSLFYSVMLGQPHEITFNLLDELNKIAFNKPIDVKKAMSEYRDYYTGAKSYVGAIKHGFRRAGAMMTKQLAGAAKMAGELTLPPPEERDRKVLFQSVRDWGIEQSEKLIGWSDMMLAAVEQYYQDNKAEAIQIAPGIGYWNTLKEYITEPTNLVQGIVESSPLILEGILGNIFGGTAAAITTMGIPITGEVYANARAEDTEILPAMAQAILTGTGEAAIEQWTLSRKLGLMKNFSRMVADGLPKIVWEAVKVFFRGTAQEGSQEFNRNFWRWVFTDRSQQWMENVEESMAAGGPMELAMAGVFSAAGVVGPTVSKENQLDRIDKIQEAVQAEPTLTAEHKAEIQKELDIVREDVRKDVYKPPPEEVKAPPTEAIPAPREAVAPITKPEGIITAKYDKASIQSATEAVKRTNPTEDRYIYATAEGFVIDKNPPLDKNQSYRVVHPDYSYEDVQPFAEGEEARKAGRRKVLQERVKRGEPTPEPLLREFKGEKWAQEALAKPEAVEVAPEAKIPAQEARSELKRLNELWDKIDDTKVADMPEIVGKIGKYRTKKEAVTEISAKIKDIRSRQEPILVDLGGGRDIEVIGYGATTYWREAGSKEGFTLASPSYRDTIDRAIEAQPPTVAKAEPTKVEKPKEPTKPGVSLLGGVPVEAPGLTRAEVQHLGKREQEALRAAQRRGLKVGYKQGAAETIADARRSLDAFRLKEAISQKGKMDVASVVLTYVPKEKQGDYIRRILEAKTQKRIERLTEAIDKYLDKYEKRQAIKGFKDFVKGIKKKYRRGEVALGQLPSKLRESLIEVLDKFDLAKISEKKEETLESRLKFVTRISGELANGFEGLNADFDKDATDLLLMGTRRIDELKRLSQKYIGDLDVDEIKYIQASLEHLLKINDLKGQSKERRRIENLRTDINNAGREVLPEKAIVKRYTGILGAVRWLGVEGQSTLRTLIGLATGKENVSTSKLLIEELDKANIQRKETYKGFIMYFRGLLKKRGLDWSDVRNLQNLTKITIGGKEIEIDYDNLLALYAYTQAEGTLRRLLKTKGLNITVYARDKNGILTKKNIYRISKPTLAELRAIKEKIPENHKKLLDVYFKTNRDKQAPAINETSTAYQNYELAIQEKYWHVSREIERVIEGKKADVSISINEQGRYLPRTGGNARINIRPFTMEVMNSMQSDAAYHTMTIPMENARTLVANTKWRDAMKKAGQQRALDEITRMLRRTQGLISDQSIIELTASRLLGTVGKSILSLRISGGLVQTASVPAAVEFIKKEYLARIDVPTRKDIQHLKDISPVLWMRWEAKQFDYALGLVGAETAFETLLFEHRALTDKLLVPYTIGDEVAIAKLFKAAERQIETETKLKRGTGEFQDASLELLYKAMNTQPQWDMIHRSPLTSDPSILARSISMFMSARNAQYNVLVRALDDYRKGRITLGQLSERWTGVGMANLFVSVARHTFKTAIEAGAITVFTALGLRKPPDEEEIKKEAMRLAKKIPLETVFNMIGLNAIGTLFVSMGYAALKTRKYGWGMGRYSDIRTGNMMADLTLDFMQLGIDFTMFTDQVISGEKYKTGKNKGRYKWEITGLRLIDDMSLLIAYRFGLPYEGPKSDIIWPVKKALPEKPKKSIKRRKAEE